MIAVHESPSGHSLYLSDLEGTASYTGPPSTFRLLIAGVSARYISQMYHFSGLFIMFSNIATFCSVYIFLYINFPVTIMYYFICNNSRSE